ncbi:hypothetical protein GFH32_15100 [Sphingobacteruim zhuxiongii]|uniref:PH domain-containing protein n=2 Tax=Sphingobacterium zhuxiongii TaxID=2662364 RepID=A0A5Q0QF23_9SPHI|nr:hypothetical protein GFH32_15100 [Sphingobacterium sp. dk4302]
MNVYRESQSFMSKWLVLLSVLLIGWKLYTVLSASVINNLAVLLSAALFLIIFVLLFSIRLKTRYDSEGIHVRFVPFVFNRLYAWSEIEEVSLKKYSLFDYGGWGYRFGRGGIAMSTSGNMGVQLQLKSGKKVLIGTQTPKEVQSVIDYYYSGEGRNSNA